jgi:hypothetical protein
LNSIDLAELIDRRVLQAERDVARAERRLAQAEHRAEQAEQAATAVAMAGRVELQAERDRTLLLQAHLNEVYASTSWRISRPVRVAKRLMQALRHQPTLPSLPPLLEPPAPPAKAPSLPPREHAILQRLQSGRQKHP